MAGKFTGISLSSLVLLALLAINPLGAIGTAAGNHQASAEVFDANGWSSAGPGSHTVGAASTDGVELTWDYDHLPSTTKTWTYQTTAQETRTLQFDWRFAGCHSWHQSDADAYIFADGPDGTTQKHVSNAGGCYFSRSGSGEIAIHDGYAFGVKVSGDHYDGTNRIDGTFTLKSAPQYTVTLQSVDPIAIGEKATVDYEVENTGKSAGAQDVRFFVDDTAVAVEPGVALTVGERHSDSFSYTPSAGKYPSVPVSVATIHDEKATTLTVNDITAPVATTGSAQTVAEDTQVAFDGSASTDNVGIVAFEWDFDGDGQTDATGSSPTHTFTDPGSFDVELTVLDDAGNQQTDTVTVSVTDTTPPTADAGSAIAVNENTTFSFDATGSTDNGQITTYEWDVDGEGSYELTGSAPTHSFAVPGVYTVTLRVTDGSGHSNTDTVAVTVVDATAPSADAGNDMTVVEDTTVSFDGTSSTDAVAVTGYAWDFDEDGVTDTTNAQPTHTFDDPGTYTIVLSVFDAAGNVGSDTTTVTVKNRRRPSVQATPAVIERAPTVGVDSKAEAKAKTRTSNVSVTNVDSEQPIVIDLDSGEAATKASTDTSPNEAPAPIANISVSELTIAVSNSDDFTLNVTTYERSENEDDMGFTRETGATSAGYVVVNHSVSDADIADVTFVFHVSQRYMNMTGIDPDEVALYRAEGAQWRKLDATPIDTTATHVVFEATSPGLSVFTIGSTIPAFDVLETSVSTTGALPGQMVPVSVSIANYGGVDGQFETSITANGKSVVDDVVSVGALGNVTTVYPVAFDEPGSYELLLDERPIGVVTITSDQEIEPETEAVESTPAIGTSGAATGWVAIVVLAVVVITALVAVRYRRSDSE